MDLIHRAMTTGIIDPARRFAHDLDILIHPHRADADAAAVAPPSPPAQPSLKEIPTMNTNWKELFGFVGGLVQVSQGATAADGTLLSGQAKHDAVKDIAITMLPAVLPGASDVPPVVISAAIDAMVALFHKIDATFSSRGGTASSTSAPAAQLPAGVKPAGA